MCVLEKLGKKEAKKTVLDNFQMVVYKSKKGVKKKYIKKIHSTDMHI